jgi:SAM-dependent methyltransferase
MPCQGSRPSSSDRICLGMRLTELQKVWEDWARADPLWAILSDPAKTQGRWDREQFFSTGREEIEAVMAHLDQKGVDLRRGRCLDFGCGVGRLTQGLAAFFDACDGVDISPTMVSQAQEFNRYPDRCFFHVNDKPDLKIFPNKSFDFIYSNIVLQHIKPEVSEGYVREFVRLLSDGGLALFQVPSAFVGIPPRQKLPEDAYLARLTLAEELPALMAGCRYASQSPWPRPSGVNLGNHWRRGDESMLVLDDGRSSLAAELQPGQATVLDLVVTTPTTAGSYILEMDMVEEDVCWFADRGSSTLRVLVQVSAAVTKPRRVLSWRRTSSSAAAKATPRLFEMHALHRDRVCAAVQESGGRILHVESYNPAGEGWESYRYYVTTAGTGIGAGS